METLTPPTDAFFSGYFMGFDSLRHLTLALDPSFAAHLKATRKVDKPAHYTIYVYEYHQWRVKLVPRDYFTIAIICYTREMSILTIASSSRLEDFPEAMHERDDDRAKRRDNFIAIVQQYTNYTVDPASLRFGCFKDLHPYHDEYAQEQYNSE